MRDKVIIDGVEVSECINISIGETYDIDNIICNDYPDCLCSDFSDCYYKQMQRLKAENEQLKKEVSDLNFYIDSYKQVWEIDKYKQVLKEIREIAEKEGIIFDNKRLFNKNIEKIINKIDEVLKDVL